MNHLNEVKVNPFRPNDTIIYTNELCGPVDGLTLGNEYVVADIVGDGCLALVGMPKWECWHYTRFTLVENTLKGNV